MENLVISKEDIRRAFYSSRKNHRSKSEVIQFEMDLNNNIDFLYSNYISGNYVNLIHYTSFYKVNNNGKKRHILKPDLNTRIYQHVFVNKIRPLYNRRDTHISYNCKPGCGVYSKNRKSSLLKRMKHLFYDMRDLKYFLAIDQRKCYEHIKISVFRKQLKRIIRDKNFIDFAVNVCFVDRKDGLPIGTPSSPMVHHIIMLDFDRFVRSFSPFVARYADNVFAAFYNKEDANTAKWRIMNYWWYELKLRSKSIETIISSLNNPVDFCGDVFHRNPGNVCSRNKGYTTYRKGNIKRLINCKQYDSYASYYGQLSQLDCYNLMKFIESRNMELSELTRKLKIDRKMDAENIQIKDLLGIKFDVIDYEIRQDKDKNPNWIKVLIGIKEMDNDGVLTGKRKAFEFHGNYQYLIKFLQMIESEYNNRSFLPIENAELQDSCGYIFKGSTNMIEYI